jgi:hypothetical protein
MALVGYDGFDHYAASAADILNRRGGGFQWNQQTGIGFFSPGRTGAGSAVYIGQNASLFGTLSTALKSAYFGFGADISTSVFPGNPTLQLLDQHGPGNVEQIRFVFNTSTAGIDVYRGTTLIASSVNNTYTLNAWNFLEFFVTIDNAAGAVTIRSNGQVVLAATGLDTQVSPNANFEGMWFNGARAPTGTNLDIDDFYIADTTTGAGLFPFDTFAGDVRVVTLHTVGNVGTPGWTPLAGTNWQEVAEAHSDGDTSYNFTTTVGAKDLFNFGPLASTITTVLAVQVTGAYRKDDSGTRTVSQHISSGGTEIAGPDVSIPGNYVYVSDFYVQDPNGSVPWTVAAVNALQAGYALTA